MSNQPPEPPRAESIAPTPAKAGAGVLRVPASRVRRVRVPTPPTLTFEDHCRITAIIDAAANYQVRVLVILVKIDGFSLVDAAAIVGYSALLSRELILSAEHIAETKIAFALREQNPDEIAPVPRGRPQGATDKNERAKRRRMK